MESRFGGVVAWCVCVVAVGCFPPALPRPDADAETNDATGETSDAKDDTQAPETEVPLSPPGSVTATTDLDDRVVVSWEATPTASGYRIFRCEGACEDEAWVSLVSVPISATSYPDETAAPAVPPTAPEVSATGGTSGRTSDVRVTWTAVTTQDAQRYAYRVVAVGPSGESAPSAVATGHLNERPVTGYEIEIDGGPWLASTGTSYTDEGAAPATLSVGAVSASQGTFADRVELTLASFGAHAGAERTYRVRAVTAWGPGEASEGEVGWRVAGTPQLSWERSADSGPDAFTAIAGANQATFQDTELPADGVIRYYRVRLTATGAAEVTSEAVAGWRQARPGVPQVTGASTELADRVEVQWAPLIGANAYHVYRGETRLTPDQGVGCTSAPCVFSDMGAPSFGAWAAPSAVGATTDLTTGVRVTWTPPVRPVGASQSYRVSALNPGGESEPSTVVQGWRAAPALTGWQVKQTVGGNDVISMIDAGETSYEHGAPLASFGMATLGATQGEHRGFVRLTLEGGALSAAPTVSYQVRGEVAGGTYTPWSTSVSGRRATGPVSRAWRFAATETPLAWSTLPEVTCASDLTTCEDTTASPLGARRWYQVALSAEGAQTFTAVTVDGWRLAFASVAAGASFSCAVTHQEPDGSRVWCWGANTSGQLGRGYTGGSREAARVLDLRDVIQLELGSDHALARKADNSVWCWGNNIRQECATTESTQVHSPRRVGALIATDISANWGTACAITPGRQAVCWGSNVGTRLGRNVTTPASSDAIEPVLWAPSVALQSVDKISVGYRHACAAQVGGYVWCWGNNDDYQLGRQTPSSSAIALEVPDLTNVADVSCGTSHTYVKTGLTVMSFGNNGWGQLGVGVAGASRSTPVTVLSTSGTGLAVSEIGAGWMYGCAILATSTPPNQAACWGSGNNGRLGLGSTDHVFLATELPGLPPVTSLSTGPDHGCAVIEGGVWCWGNNASGQLGPSSEPELLAPTLVALP